MQYCTASAAALGLSQFDLLKLEKALATPQTGNVYPSPSVVWLTGQACSGCQTSLLNRVIQTDGQYYDREMINALYTAGLTPKPNAADPVLELNAVNDAADLLVGDAVAALVPALAGGRDLTWRDDLNAFGASLGIPDSLLDAYDGNFPTGYATVEWMTTVMASAGDIPVQHLKGIVEDGNGLLGGFLVIVDGSIPYHPAASFTKKYCLAFDNDDGTGTQITTQLPLGAIPVADALEWMAGQAGCLGVISMGTCAAFGGIPAARTLPRNWRTTARSVQEFFAMKGIGTPVINVGGCPPHPDWLVYTVAYILIHSTYNVTDGLTMAFPPLDGKGRPDAVFGEDPFCNTCANRFTQGTPDEAQFLGDWGCIRQFGCKGKDTMGDCPVRMKNTMDDGTKPNWCVGAGEPGGLDDANIGQARHPCQGCIEPDFPDGKSWFYTSQDPYDPEGP